MLLLDGSNFCHKALEAFKANNGHYDYEGAISYVLSMVAGIARKRHLQDNIIVAFDTGVPIHRRELFSEYKPDKNPVGEVSKHILSKINNSKESQLSDERKCFLEEYAKLVNILNSIIFPLSGCISIKVDNCEADDIIAFFVHNFPNQEFTIVSSDRDLLQLINQNVQVYELNKKMYFGLEDMEEAGYILSSYKKHFLYTKAIIGDTSDGIEGVQGVGDKNSIKYANQLVTALESNSSLTLVDALATLDRNARASAKALEDLKNSASLIERNYKLMDLEYTATVNPELINSIRRKVLMYLNLSPDYTKLIEKINTTSVKSDKYYRYNLDAIYDSNHSNNIKELLQELV